MAVILAVASIVIGALAVLMLALVLVRSRAEVRRHQIQEGGEGSVNIQAGRDITSQRRVCCPTPPNTAHIGTCKNSMMNTGEEWFFINDLQGRRAALRQAVLQGGRGALGAAASPGGRAGARLACRSLLLRLG